MNISRKRSEYYKRANKDLYKSGLCGITALFSVCIIAFVSNIFYDSDNHKFYTVVGGKNEELPKTVASVIEEEIYDDPVWYSLCFFDA